MKPFLRLLALSLIFATALASPARAAKPTDEEKKLLKEVADKLLAKMKRVEGYASWPPDIALVDDDDIDPKLRFNAWAWYDGARTAASPHIRVTVEWMRNVVKGDADALAYVLGHELGHIHHKHILDPNRAKEGKTAFSRVHYERKGEYEADDFGAKLLAEAGFDMHRALMGQTRIKQFSLRHSALDTLESDHPGWDDRFARMAKDSKVWQAIATFNLGVSFLAAENFAAAEFCFAYVTTVFPKSYEAWVNLGYARLMQYCDQLDEKDLKSFGVGKVLCGGFYRRAGTIEGTRGINDKLWFKAVGALNEALKLKPDLSLARANLGVAYLLHPEGTNSEKAEEYLQTAADAVMEDRTLDPLSRATTLVNFAVAQLARGNNKDAMKFLAKAAEVSKELKGPETTVLAGALWYNNALALSGSMKSEEKAQALTLMEQYLEGDDSGNSYWWPVGYERYTELCKALKREPKTKEAFASRRAPILRMQATVTLKGGLTVSLAEDIEPVLKRLGKHTVSELADAALKRYRFEEHGIEVLASDRVIAIVLSLPTSPVLKVRPRGVGGKEVEIKVGMTGKELLEKMPGANDFVFRELTFPKEEYYYYRHLGLAINFDSFPGGKITELILVQIPG